MVCIQSNTMKESLKYTALLLLATTSLSSATPVTQIKVMSFNIWVSGGDSLSQCIDAINTSGADLVGLQECNAATAQTIATSLGFYVLPAGDCSIVSRYPILSSQVIGNDGTVQNNAPNTDLSSSLTALPDNYLDAAAQLSHRCGASDPDSRSRLTVQGRGGWPPDPDQPATTRATGCSAKSPTLINTAPLAVAPITQSSAATANFGDY